MWERRKQDKINYKRYENAFIGFLLMIVFTGIGIGLLGMILAVLG
jgi:hypothetical protein